MYKNSKSGGDVMAAKIFIDGHEGTTGLRLSERLSEREDITAIPIEEKYRKNKEAVRECMAQADVIFLCLPDGAARDAAEEAEKCSHAVIIDTSTAHRTAPGWTYGFPELSEKQRESIKKARKIAVPGCHASGMIAVLYPLLQTGVMGADYPVSVCSVTGYSGGGKKMIKEYNSPSRPIDYDAPRVYALGQKHKHIPEVVRMTGLSFPPSFSPIVGPFYAGMDVMIPLSPRLLRRKMTAESMREVYQSWYGDSACVQISQQGSPAYITASAMAGTDSMKIYVTGSDDCMVVHAVFDNLGKGASGAAVQCMNLALGFRETEGLCIWKGKE